MSKDFKPYISANESFPEFTIRALIAGLFFAILLGAANAYLGLKAGMTIAATYPAAVLGMAFLRLCPRHNILEENFVRTVGSIGESIAAGAIFTLPAFIIAGVWDTAYFASLEGYIKCSVIMLIGSLAGIFFVTLLRRVMVEDPELPYPESVAASEIHKAGSSGSTGAAYLFIAMIVGGLIQFLKEFKALAGNWQGFIPFTKKLIPGTEKGTFAGVESSGGFVLKTPELSPAFLGVGYIIGIKLAALNFAGALLAWGLFVPILLLVLAPNYAPIVEAGNATWTDISNILFANVVKPMAIGGMLMSAAYTLFKMRKSLWSGIKRSVGDVKKAAQSEQTTVRTEQDLNIKFVFASLAAIAVIMFFVYWWFMGFSGDMFVASLVATIVMMIAGFLFAAVSGYLVGLIGSSNNPVSGLTLSTLMIAAIMMVLLGVTGKEGVVVVLAVAGVICVSSAVAGEMLQDLKVGHILGGTPWKMQTGNLIAVFFAAMLMWFPLLILQQGDIAKAVAEANTTVDANIVARLGENATPEAIQKENELPAVIAEREAAIANAKANAGFGGPNLPAPQAGLMAKLASGIVGGEMVWPLVIMGIIMALAFIAVQIKSPMLVCVGMYLSFGTVAAIFIGGIIRWILDGIIAKRTYTDEQKSNIDNCGLLLSSGLIAGEALMGLLFAGLAFFEIPIKSVCQHPSYWISIIVFIILGAIMIKVPLKRAQVQVVQEPIEKTQESDEETDE
ncbi:MAG TPA: oligopeptide transporter, OPT family [Planctomycetota bacterium]|nr:oligopeptide transporter, OPT family [Planctomycetota bacterium]HQB00965.1 oligopeptide transporter, OPT family [Planctomycetota bacterium]